MHGMPALGVVAVTQFVPRCNICRLVYPAVLLYHEQEASRAISYRHVGGVDKPPDPPICQGLSVPSSLYTLA